MPPGCTQLLVCFSLIDSLAMGSQHLDASQSRRPAKPAKSRLSPSQSRRIRVSSTAAVADFISAYRGILITALSGLWSTLSATSCPMSHPEQKSREQVH